MLQAVGANQFVKHGQLGLIARALGAPVQTPQRIKVCVLLPLPDESPVVVEWNFDALVEPTEEERARADAALPPAIVGGPQTDTSEHADAH